MKKTILSTILALALCSCVGNQKNNEIKIVERHENVLYNISIETGELTVIYDYQEINGNYVNGTEYKTMDYVYARYLSTNHDLSNVFYIRENAPDLIVAYYH